VNIGLLWVKIFIKGGSYNTVVIDFDTELLGKIVKIGVVSK
jgi:hypothetical protein